MLGVAINNSAMPRLNDCLFSHYGNAYGQFSFGIDAQYL